MTFRSFELKSGEFVWFSLKNKFIHYQININLLLKFRRMTLCPKKYMIKNIVNQQPPLDVWLQGTIEQTVGSDILIVSDTSGRAKITKCEAADGIIDKTSLRKGTYCCIIGTAVKTKGLAEVQASKFLDLSSQPHMKTAWEYEVKEADLFHQGQVQPAT